MDEIKTVRINGTTSQVNYRTYNTPSWALSNPDAYIEPMLFYSGEHSEEMQRYIASVFPKNGDKLRKKMTRITQRFVQSGANLYKYDLKRKFAGKAPSFETIVKINSEMMLAERFQFYLGISALWISNTGSGTREEDYDFIALSPAQFSYRKGSNGEIEAFFLRRNSYLDTNGIEWWEWFMFFEGTILVQVSDSFWGISNDLGDDVSGEYASGNLDPERIKKNGWHAIGSYNTLPFLVIYSDRYKYTPNRNTDTAQLEKDHVADLTLVRAAMLVAMIKMLVAPGATEEDRNKIYEVFGTLDGIISGPQSQNQPTALDMGDTKNHLDFMKFARDEMISICIQYGVDYTVIMQDEDTHLSAVSRQSKLAYRHDVRAEREVGYRPVEFRLFRLLNSISPMFPLLEWVKFNPLPVFLSSEEQARVRSVDAATDINLMKNKIVLRDDLIEKYNPEKTEDDLEILKRILNGGGNDIKDDDVIDVDSIVDKA